MANLHTTLALGRLPPVDCLLITAVTWSHSDYHIRVTAAFPVHRRAKIFRLEESRKLFRSCHIENVPHLSWYLQPASSASEDQLRSEWWKIGSAGAEFQSIAIFGCCCCCRCTPIECSLRNCRRRGDGSAMVWSPLCSSFVLLSSFAAPKNSAVKIAQPVHVCLCWIFDSGVNGKCWIQ